MGEREQRRLGWWLRIMLLVCCCSPGARKAEAQSLRGTIVDVNSAPVTGAVVLLVNVLDSVVARALSSDRGAFLLQAPVAGRYNLRTLRLGYRPLLSAAFELAQGERADRRIVLSGLQFTLDTVRVVGTNACRALVDSARATFAVWEQVVTALTATQLSANERTIATTTLNYSRTVDRNLERVRDQRTWFLDKRDTRSWPALSADSLRMVGYVALVNDSTTYFAPDIDVLLSHEFVEDHCFHLATSANIEQVGIAFEPIPARRNIPEIRGTLWVDRKTSELRQLEFKYTNVAHEQEQYSSGTLDFLRLSTGAWVVRRWNIRMPQLAALRSRDLTSHAAEIIIRAIAVEGGELVTVRQSGDTLWTRAPVSVSGFVTDSITGAPVANARISLDGAAISAKSAIDGSFSLLNALPGEYTADVRTPALDAIGISTQHAIRITDSVTHLSVRVPAVSSIASALCSVTAGSRTGIVMGRVTQLNDTAQMSNLRVFASWSSDASRQQLRATTDAAGRFRICGVPRGTSLEIQAEVDSANADPVSVRIDSGLFVRADLAIDRLAGRGATFSGLVADTARTPIGSAEVALADLGMSVKTDERGHFQFREIPAGSHKLSVRRLGYQPLDTTFVFTARQKLSRTILLPRVVTLDSQRVVAERSHWGRGMEDFEERRKLGFGKFFDSEFLRKNEHRRADDILREVPGINLVHPPPAIGGSGRPIPAPGAMRVAWNNRMQCAFQVVYDGVVVGRSKKGATWEDMFDIRGVVLQQLESIEVYRGAAEIPSIFLDLNSNCGVLVLWSRQP